MVFFQRWLVRGLGTTCFLCLLFLAYATLITTPRDKELLRKAAIVLSIADITNNSSPSPVYTTDNVSRILKTVSSAFTTQDVTLAYHTTDEPTSKQADSHAESSSNEVTSAIVGGLPDRSCVNVTLGKISEPVACEQVNLTGKYRTDITSVPRVVALCQRTRIRAPLVTMITTMHHSSRLLHVHNNTLRLWKQLGDRVRTVLFVSSTIKEEELIRLACRYEWDVYVVPYCGLSQQLPLLKVMYMAAEATSCNQPSLFYGYANSDILFDESLLDTLEFLEPHYKVISPVLMVGRRTILKVHENIQSLLELRLRVAASNSSQASVVGVDYFLTSRDYPWPNMPNVVIGRIAYDNWIIQNAKRKRRMTIELTNSTLSVHQSADNRYYKSHHTANAGINNKVVGKFDFTQGLITCASFKAVLMGGDVHLMKRVKYGMCGAGHWAKRKKHPFGINELTVEVDPANLGRFIGEAFHPAPGT